MVQAEDLAGLIALDWARIVLSRLGPIRLENIRALVGANDSRKNGR
jgi:hypothetical protein